jgi:hypothetical protein
MLEELPILVERAIFDPEDLSRLKDAISAHSAGQLTTRELKELIVTDRTIMMHRILKLFPFYLVPNGQYDDVHPENYNRGESSSKDKTIIQSLTARLNKYEALLETIARKLQVAPEKLVKSVVSDRDYP